MKKTLSVAALVAALSTPMLASAQFPRGHFGAGGAGGAFASNAAIEADRTALEDAFRALRADVRGGNTSAVAGDEAAINAALAKLQSDRAALTAAMQSSPAVQSAKTTLQADHMAIERDRTQLRIDQIAGNQAAVGADEQLLAKDEAQLRTDMKALQDAIAALAI
jgi:hypothetical protein